MQFDQTKEDLPYTTASALATDEGQTMLDTEIKNVALSPKRYPKNWKSTKILASSTLAISFYIPPS